jgi:hypothetical protein
MSGTVLEALSLFHLSQARLSSPDSSDTHSTISSDESTESYNESNESSNDLIASIDASQTSIDDDPRFPPEIMQKIFQVWFTD